MKRAKAASFLTGWLGAAFHPTSNFIGTKHLVKNKKKLLIGLLRWHQKQLFALFSKIALLQPVEVMKLLHIICLAGYNGMDILYEVAYSRCLLKHIMTGTPHISGLYSLKFLH